MRAHVEIKCMCVDAQEAMMISSEFTQALFLQLHATINVSESLCSSYTCLPSMSITTD